MDDNRITYPCPFCGQMVMIKDGGGGSPGGSDRSMHLF